MSQVKINSRISSTFQENFEFRKNENQIYYSSNLAQNDFTKLFRTFDFSVYHQDKSTFVYFKQVLNEQT